MIKQFLSYFIPFSSRFVFRAIFWRILKTQVDEVRLLFIWEKLFAKASGVTSLKENKIKVNVLINQVLREVILRKNTSDLLVMNQVICGDEYATLHQMIVEAGKSDNIKVILDVGANIGITTLYLAAVFPGASVYAIEPSHRNFRILQENIDNNAINAFAVNKAILASRCRVRVTNTFRDRRDWSSRVISSGSDTDVEALSLTDLKLELGLDKIDVIKIDIEGHESELFNSEAFLSELKRIRFIAIEIHDEEADRIAIINALQSLGYNLASKGQTLFGSNETA